MHADPLEWAEMAQEQALSGHIATGNLLTWKMEGQIERLLMRFSLEQGT